MKHLITLVIAGFLLFSTNPQSSYSQNIKTKTSKDFKRGPVKVSKEEVLNSINKNTRSFKKDLNGTWILDEDFESGIFPPPLWTISSGATQWDQYSVSGYGTGDYSMFYSSWNCNYSNTLIQTAEFTPTATGDKLIFDYAYAPYDDGFSYYDDLEIFYYDTLNLQWYSLVYYPGTELQTSPGTGNYFVPQSNEWGTKVIDLPEGAYKLYFQVYENCSNNLFVDNIRVGTVSSSDASVDFVWAKGKLPLGYGTPDKIPVLVKNLGASPILNLKVYLNISGANNLSDSINIPSLGPGDTMQVDFMGFIPIINGFSDVTVTIPDDEDNGNNSKTFLSEATSNTIRHVDSNCCNGSVGWIGAFSFLNKYYMNGTGQIRDVNIKISGGGNVGQIVYGYVIDNNGLVVGKSSHYKLQASDEGNYKTFRITDPKPVIITNDYYYVGIAQTEYSGPDFAFTPQQFLAESPARPDANYYAGLVPPGSVAGTGEFPREYGQNYAIEAVMGNQATIDAGISDLGLTYDQYFSSTTYSPVGKVFNAGTGPVTFSVRRTINPGGYSSTKTVSALTTGFTALVTYDPWTFTSGTVYTIRDSILLSDGNNTNNQMTNIITPKIAKQMCILWQQQNDRDSLVRAINQDGRYANNFDTVRMNYTGSYRPWKIMFTMFKEEASYSPWIRDSLKQFIDNSTPGNKKTMVMFSDATANNNDPVTGFPSPADSIFFRQYLKSMTISDDWIGSIPSSQSRFRGIGFFDGISQDSVSDPYTPELIKPVNGGSAAFKPQSVTGNGSDSCNAVSFAGANYNTFFMTNQFSSLRSTGNSPSLNIMGPVRVYTKIIDWIQSVNTGAKAMDLTVQLEGFYNIGTNTMVSDTMRVYLRSSVNPFPKIDSAKAYLNAAGQGSFIFNNAANGTPYYIQLKHRSGLETWSKTTQTFSSNHLAYNFTSDSAKSFGNNLKKQGSKWVVFGGDVNQDGFVDLTDVIAINNNANVFTTGYIKTDVNGDNFTDLTDVILAYNNSSIFAQRKTPLSEPQLLAEKENEQDGIVQNSAAQSTQYLNGEIKIDNEIYERFKNEQSSQSKIPDMIYFNKGNTQNIIKGSKITGKNR
jgi:hypothetical protein